jgi:hypothetical protein
VGGRSATATLSSSSLAPASGNPDAASSWPIVAGLSFSLTVRAELDQDHYQKSIKVTDEEFKSIQLIQHAFHDDWNYTIRKSTEG